MKLSITTVKKMKIMRDELDATKQALALSMQERTNIRKAYDEVNQRSETVQTTYRSQMQDLTRVLQNVQASNQQLSQENARIMETAKALALEKDKMSNALTSMWVRFEELIGKYHEATGHKAA